MGKNVNVKEAKSIVEVLRPLPDYSLSVKIAGESIQYFQIPAGAEYLELVILPPYGRQEDWLGGFCIAEISSNGEDCVQLLRQDEGEDTRECCYGYYDRAGKYQTRKHRAHALDLGVVDLRYKLHDGSELVVANNCVDALEIDFVFRLKNPN